MVKKKKISAGDRTFHIAVLVIVLLMCVITLYPIYYMLIVSISDGNAVLQRRYYDPAEGNQFRCI